MQVNLTTSPGLSVRGPEGPPQARPLERTRDQAVFDRTEVLNRALEDTPDARTEELLRARDLFQQVQYPPVEIIHRISRLLAKEWTSGPA